MGRGETIPSDHSFSSWDEGPRTWLVAIWLGCAPAGLIAGGSGIVSIAATKTSRHRSETRYLRFKLTSTKEDYAPGGAAIFRYYYSTLLVKIHARVNPINLIAPALVLCRAVPDLPTLTLTCYCDPNYARKTALTAAGAQ